MPIKVQNGLPARAVLEQENIFLMVSSLNQELKVHYTLATVKLEH